MNRGLTIVGRFGANTCPRCGHVAARDHCYCSVCGALLPSTRAEQFHRGVSLTPQTYEAKYPQSMLRQVGRYAGRLVGDPDRPALPWRPSIVSETVTIRTTLLVSIALSAATGVIVYLMSTTHVSAPVVTEAPPPLHVEQETSEPEAIPSGGYLTEKTLHDIDASIKTPTGNVRDLMVSNAPPKPGATNEGLGDGARDGQSRSECQPAGQPPQQVDSAPQPVCQTNGAPEGERVNSRKTIFSETTDPVALERTIREYGWSKTNLSP